MSTSSTVLVRRHGAAEATFPAVGLIGRLGRWTAGHVRVVVVAWVVVAIGLGVFAPRAEHALSERAGRRPLRVRRRA